MIRHLIQIRAGQYVFGRNSHSFANRSRYICLITGQYFRRYLPSFQSLHRCLRCFFRSIKECKISHQNHIIFICWYDLILFLDLFTCNSNYFHAILKHLIHYRSYTPYSVFFHRKNFATKFHMAAPGHNPGNIAFHNKLTIPVFICHQCTDKFSGIIKRDFIFFPVLREKIHKMLFVARHRLTGKNRIVNRIAYP